MMSGVYDKKTKDTKFTQILHFLNNNLKLLYNQ